MSQKMNIQRVLLIFPAALAFTIGLLAIFVPKTLMKIYDIPMSDIFIQTPHFIGIITIMGLALIGLGIICLWIRTLTDPKAMKGGMTCISIIIFLFGLESIFEPFFIKGMTFNIVTVITGVILPILAVFLFIYRNPKIATN
jgi:hypothetical protein